MAQTKPKRNPNKNSSAKRASQNHRPAAAHDVLTLAEAAAYLRLPEADIIRLVNDADLPGRTIGIEWRFLKAAIEDWLRCAATHPSKEAALSRIGSWKDDPHVEEELKEIYRQRGRPMTEDAS
ncbi:MAG: helix-turn-helix domain-containing protein [Gemmataceae bacterium]